MQELFDKILSGKIKTVFNEHQESYNPADWEKLKVQLAGNKRGLVIWLNIAKAASVVLFVGISTFYVNRNVEKVQLPYSLTANQVNVNSNKSKENGKVYIAHVKNESKEIYKLNEQIVTDSSYNGVKNNIADETNDPESVKNILIRNQTDSAKSEEIIVFDDSRRIDSLKQIVQIQFDENNFVVDEKEQDSKFDFAVAVASMYSYSAQGTKGYINMGGGFTSSYNVSDKFSISSGVLIAQQSLDYNNSQSLAYAAESELYGSNTTLVSNPSTAKTKIEFVGIDIPLNLKYKIKKIIITTGISSLIFVSEKRTYSADVMVLNTEFNSATNGYETIKSYDNIQTEDNSPAFNHFDFASLLNIAVGYKVPLKKGSILFEPFLKYPLGEISSANLKIGSGGLSLHYYF